MGANNSSGARVSDNGGRSNGDKSSTSQDMLSANRSGVNEGRWSKLEHCSFLKALKENGRDWKKVAKQVGTRTSTQCRSHAQKFIVSLQKQGIQLDEVLTN